MNSMLVSSWYFHPSKGDVHPALNCFDEHWAARDFSFLSSPLTPDASTACCPRRNAATTARLDIQGQVNALVQSGIAHGKSSTSGVIPLRKASSRLNRLTHPRSAGNPDSDSCPRHRVLVAIQDATNGHPFGTATCLKCCRCTANGVIDGATTGRWRRRFGNVSRITPAWVRPSRLSTRATVSPIPCQLRSCGA